MARKDKRAEIMDAAEMLFTNRRLHEITLDDVVAQANIGKGTIYRYFHSKDDLFFETATRGFDDLRDLLGRNVPEDGPFGQQLLTACRLIDRFFHQRRQLFRMMQSEEARIRWCHGEMRQRWTRRRRELVSAIAEIIKRGVGEGAIRRDVDPDVLAAFLLGMLRTKSRHLDDAPGRKLNLESVVDLYCRGTQAAPACGTAKRR
jgi:AcrR family transcriptional regulator